MTCTCEEEVNNLLKPKDERLSVAFDTAGKTYYVVKVEKISDGQSKTTLLLANHCPFCGKKQEEK